MKRNDLLKHLRVHDCELLREGGRHSWWHNPEQTNRSAIPRHSEISDILAKKICKDLGVPPFKEFRSPIPIHRRSIHRFAR